VDTAQLAQLADLGLGLTVLCGPACDGAAHHHAPDSAGKVPLRMGWQRTAYRTAAELLQEYRSGCNLGVVCGPVVGAAVSVAVIDGDDAAALEWMAAHLPPTPWRVRTRHGEHWYYRAPAGSVGNRNLHKSHGLAIDVRAAGGQVVAPGSVHRTGHEYTVIGAAWTAESAAALPVYDPAWLPAPVLYSASRAAAGSAQGASGAGGGAVAWSAPAGSTWPSGRTFNREDFAESAERVLSYVERLPASVSGSDGHGTALRAAIAVLRGWPLISAERFAAMDPCTPVPVDAADAMGEALRILSARWNPRCTKADGETPYPWTPAELAHKVEGAARADRLPGDGDYWIFDDAPHRERYASARGRNLWERAIPENEEPPTVAAVEGSEMTTDNERVQQTMDPVNATAPPSSSSSLEDMLSMIAGAAPDAQPEPDAQPATKAGSAFEAPIETVSEAPADAAPVSIEIDHDTERMKEKAMVALATMPGVYVRGMTLTDMVKASGTDRHGQPKRPWLRKTGKVWLKSRMNSAVNWYKLRTVGGKEVEVRERADAETVGAILASGEWPRVAALEGIVYTPVVRRDGSILQTPGYDRVTRLYYHPEVEHGVIDAATNRELVQKARDYLLGVVQDFPFVDRPLAQSVWLAAVLTRFCRYSYSGLAPMFAVSARESGSGKTLLADCAAIIADGRPADMLPYTGDEEEAKREILSLLGRDETHSICLDNLKVPLKGAAFEAMLTGSSTVGREVGSSDVKRIVMSDAVWWATGNDLEIGADMSRRVLLIDIYDTSGKPADRPRKHADLRAYCRANRCNLVRAALTILAGFAAERAPLLKRDCDDVPMGEFASFESWAKVVRQAVVWAGLPDPCRAMATATEAATEGTRAGHLVEHWRAAFGTDPIQTSEAARRLKGDPKKYAALINYLADHGCTDPKPVSLGMHLKNNMKGVYTAADGSKWILTRKETAKGVVWSVRTEA